eukprot:4645228-Karenia_brevis.AAC.1
MVPPLRGAGGVYRIAKSVFDDNDKDCHHDEYDCHDDDDDAEDDDDDGGDDVTSTNRAADGPSGA